MTDRPTLWIDGDDSPRHVYGLVAGEAAGVEDVVVRFYDPVRPCVLRHAQDAGFGRRVPGHRVSIGMEADFRTAAATLESQMIHPIQLLPERTLSNWLTRSTN
jgi:hypothetical protein